MIEGIGSGQYGEDRILSLVFRDQEIGLLVDAGASDGFHNSNSIGLLRRPGWKGVLIEPEHNQFQELATRYSDRPGVFCIHYAIGMEEGERTLYAGGQVSTFDEEVKRSAEINHGVVFTLQQVQVMQLTHLLDRLEVKEPIDFLSIDTEGTHYEVWQSLDKQRHSPKLVCMEGKGYCMEGYKELCQTGGNTFYLREELCGLL